MKTLLSIVSFILLSNHAYGAIISCDCQIEKVYAGMVGVSNSQNYSVECNRPSSDNLVYVLGTADSELAKARYSMALSALLAGKDLTLQFGDVACITAYEDGLTPDGMYLAK